MKKGLICAGAVCLLWAAWMIWSETSRQPQSDCICLPDAAAREGWLNLRGWQVKEPIISPVRMPQDWVTSAGQDWLCLQHRQGLYPDDYPGAEAICYRYPICDAGAQYAELYLCGDILIAAQVYDPETGIMQSVQLL